MNELRQNYLDSKYHMLNFFVQQQQQKIWAKEKIHVLEGASVKSFKTATSFGYL